MATREISVPDIGDFKDVDVIEVLVKPGDAVQPEQSLITVESDKATMEIPSPAAGVVKEMRVKTGDKVSKGSLILLLDADGGSASPAPRKAQEPAAPVAAPTAPRPAPAAPAPVVPIGRPAPPLPDAARSGDSVPHASPSVRKFARELGVDLA